MKKILTLITAALTLAAVFAGCAGAADVAGKWTIKSMTADGQMISGEDYESVFGEYTLTFEKDGAVTSVMLGSENTGTYEVDGDIVRITFNGSTEEAKLDGDTLTIAAGNAETVFEKQ